MPGVLWSSFLLVALAEMGDKTQLPPRVLAVGVALGFFARGAWTLIPDRPTEPGTRERWGPFVTTALLFFGVEMGDKTQLATVALGARFHSTVLVTVGTTLGMLAANGLAVFDGAALATRLPMHYLRWSAAALFWLFGGLALAFALRRA